MPDNAWALCALGHMHHETDYAKARECYEKAVERKSPLGAHLLARLNQDLAGPGESCEQEFELHMRAAEAGFPHAMFDVAALYSIGMGAAATARRRSSGSPRRPRTPARSSSRAAIRRRRSFSRTCTSAAKACRKARASTAAGW